MSFIRHAVRCGQGAVDCLVTELVIADAQADLGAGEERGEEHARLEDSLARCRQARLTGLNSRSSRCIQLLRFRTTAFDPVFESLSSSKPAIGVKP